MPDFPRRIRLDLMTPEELAIFNMVGEIEKLGAHPLLTDVVVLLGEARGKLADWVDLTLPASVTAETDEEKLCATCGHSESRHQTAGGFCKHCTCTQFVEELTSKPTIKKLLGDWLEERRLAQNPPLPQDATIYIMAFVAWVEKKEATQHS